MRFEKLKELVRALPELSSWPQIHALLERPIHRDSISVWEYPVAACRAVGGTEEAALPGAAAIFCSVISIHLVDDMLDEDPRGDYRRIGAGQTANLALAFQAAGHLVLDDPSIRPEIRSVLQASLAGMSLATCFGQDLDARELVSEEEYWRVVENKTPPLFAEAFRMGALLGGAPVETADRLAHLGRVLGRFIQVSDDLTDAMETPARADWQRRSNNLPILYAMTAEHAERMEFLRLAAEAEEPSALAAAQKILLRSGAVGFCALKLIHFSREAHDLLARIQPHNPAPLQELLALHVRPLYRLLVKAGIEEPEALALS